MNSETFEEIPCGVKVVGDRADWISEGGEVTLVIFKEKIIEVMVPSPATFKILETEPNMKGNTSSGYTKPAVLDCGATINVPGYLNQGELIRVDTDRGEFLERFKP
jgi:elongation factor P